MVGIIAAKKIQEISSIIHRDEIVDFEIKTKPYLSGCTMCDEEGDGAPGAHDKFILECLLRDIDRSLKSAATTGHQSIRFHVDYDANKSNYYKKFILYVCIILWNRGYRVDIEKEFAPECSSQDDGFDIDIEDYCQSRRIISLLIKW